MPVVGPLVAADSESNLRTFRSSGAPRAAPAGFGDHEPCAPVGDAVRCARVDAVGACAARARSTARAPPGLATPALRVGAGLTATPATPVLNVPARGLAAACMCVPARRLPGDATVPRVRVTRAGAGRSCRAGRVPRAPRSGLAARSSDRRTRVVAARARPDTTPTSDNTRGRSSCSRTSSTAAGRPRSATLAAARHARSAAAAAVAARHAHGRGALHPQRPRRRRREAVEPAAARSSSGLLALHGEAGFQPDAAPRRLPLLRAVPVPRAHLPDGVGDAGQDRLRVRARRRRPARGPDARRQRHGRRLPRRARLPRRRRPEGPAAQDPARRHAHHQPGAVRRDDRGGDLLDAARRAASSAYYDKMRERARPAPRLHAAW